MRHWTMMLVVLLSVCALIAAGCGDDDDDDGGGGGGDGGGSVYGGGGGDETERTEAERTEKADEPSSGSAATRLKLTADPSGAPMFDKTALRAKPGKVTVVLENPSPAPHAIEVEGAGVEEVGETVQQGGVSRVTAELKAGEYEFYCPVGNHADAGMEGTLTVR